ncbi:protein phosphatase 1F isoform A [Patagioenas fasciata monilis]|uniref:Protein phosphatase 1F n=3 Tax=Columbidae TaxID=8930 RepID=A0A1V4JRP1_PATFA|nr:protein phosphatase 1F isoform A [Patagioenas fasciata monilis]
MALEVEASATPLNSFLKDFPSPLGPGEPLPWSSAGSGALSKAEVPGALAERARSLLDGRGVSPLLAASLIHAAVDEVLQTDLTEFEQQNVETEGEGDEERFTLLDGESLQRCFFNKLRDVCFEWQKQLPPLRPVKRFLLVSIHAIRNTRRKMEDRHVLLPEFNQLFGLSDDVDRAYFAVFDGHGGVDAANYSATHLHVNVGLHEDIVKNPAEALKCSFQKTDEMFLFKAKREKLRSGTTGVTALIVGNKLHIAWLGDSQIMLVQQGKAVTLMEPHKPEREDERARIETLGGCVTYMDCWRVNGTLGVSRAIGDICQKPYISGDADGESFELTGSEDYLLLACDGFFDVIKPYEVVDLVLEHLMQTKGVGLKAAERLVAAAKENGSSDNITVLVVFLRDPQDILADCLRDPKNHGAVVLERSGFSAKPVMTCKTDGTKPKRLVLPALLNWPLTQEPWAFLGKYST